MQPTSQSIEAELDAELGPSVDLFAAPAEWLRALGLGGQALPAAAPRDEEAAAALVAWAGRVGRAFCIVGGASGLHIGASPKRCGFLLSTKYLSHVHEFDEGNATIEAGAGIALRDLDAVARGSRQFVPLESGAGSTLGGAASGNVSHSRSQKWGTPRDLVTGARALLSDGREVRGGGKVVKNVSGYDLPKLFVGSRGSLGLLTRLTLRLRPLSERSVRVAWTCEGLDEAARLWRLLEGREFEWSGLRADFSGGSGQLFAWCEGSERAVAHQLERVPQPDTVQDVRSDGCQEPWLEEVAVAARVPRMEAGAWLESASRSGAKRLSWECASGAVRAAWDEASWESLAALRHQAEGCGGWMVVENCPSEWKSWERVWGDRRSDWPLMQRLKTAYDAADVCSPGRFAGGL